ncbi:uncharacterized protein LOC124296944 isoform X2 [Neodiprion virginianus]|uniref:uncharacterized protein LOC124296944 isoform X2 n=1 Tax=Neodiprion virginianus TaxID=2961670 RepID=UPI001EE72D6F|nr:uncharacterized protein LOC124296944 isoform X2 [Neodiprion virginianus]
MELYFDHSSSATGSNIRGCPGTTGLRSAVVSIFEKPSDQRGTEEPTDDRPVSVPAELRWSATESVVATAPAPAHASATAPEQHTSVRTKAAGPDATTTAPAPNGPTAKGHEQRSDSGHDALRPIAYPRSYFGIRRHRDGETFLHGTYGTEQLHDGRTEASSADEPATNTANGSTQFQKSSNGLQDQTRTKREVRDGAGESGSKRYRQPKNSRQQLDGVAANSPVKLKPDTTVVPPQQNPQSPSKSNDDHVVGDSRKINDDTVGGPLDDLIETLRSSGLANPLMELLNGGGYIPQSNFLGKSSSGIPQFEEHVVGQSHQQQQQSDQNPLMSMLGRHQNPPYTSYGYRHPHHMPPPYGIRPTKYYPYRNTALGSPSSPMNEGGSTQFQGDQGQGFWTGSSRQIQPVTGTGNVPQAGAPESPKSISKAPNPAAKFVSDPVIRYSVSHKKNEDPVVVSPNPNTSKATQPAETSKPIASESPMNPTPIQSQTLLPVHGATGKPPVIGAQYPFNMVPHNMVQMMAPYNSMMRSMSPLVGAVNPTDQLSGLLYTLANQLSALGRGGDQYGMNDRFQNYREANFGLGDLLDRGYGSYPGQGSYGTISGIGYNESPYSTTSGYGDPSFPYNQQPFIF